jgi:acetyl esterase/lipase
VRTVLGVSHETFRLTLDCPLERVLKIHNLTIPVKDGEIPVRIYTPQPDVSKGEVKGHTYPLFVWFHGGGASIHPCSILLSRYADVAPFPPLYRLALRDAARTRPGHCIGTLESDDWRLRDIAVEKRISVLNVLYRHAPEFLWPTDIDDCYASLKWASIH